MPDPIEYVEGSNKGDRVCGIGVFRFCTHLRWPGMASWIPFDADFFGAMWAAVFNPRAGFLTWLLFLEFMSWSSLPTRRGRVRECVSRVALDAVIDGGGSHR